MNATHSFKSRPPSRRRERGVTALAITMLLFFAMALGIGFVNRNLIFEARASANQYRATQAFEAAEAGLEWALAELNDDRRIGLDCLTATDTAAMTFRERYLRQEVPSGGLTPTTWTDGTTTRPLQAACFRDGDGWRCSCPSSGRADLDRAGAPAGPAFLLRFEDAGKAGLIRAIAVGCSTLGGACATEGGDSTDAVAQVQVLFALLPSIRTLPAAALTVRGTVDADLAALGIGNHEAASTGLAIDAGGNVAASRVHISGPAGASTANAIAHNDAALAALSPGQFFASYFGLDDTHWAQQPRVHRLVCDGDCTAALLAAIDRAAEPALVHVDGDLRLTGPATFGSPERPVVIVASGSISIDGAVGIDGVVYGRTLSWTGPDSSAAFVHGALLSEGDYRGDGAPEIVRDAAVLARLQRTVGTFARVAGSWRDF